MLDYLPGLSVVTQIIVVVLAFSVLIFVHELGHYLAAVFTGVRVERFFIGFDIFGLALKKEYKGTIYGVGILPLGGYCALAGQNDDPRKERVTGAPDELQSKSLPARALVFGGGVLMNFIFGFIVLVAAYMHGIPFIPAIVGTVDPSGSAALYGLKSGDRIVSVNGKAIESFEEAVEAVALNDAGGEMDMVLERRDAAGKAETLSLKVKGRAGNMRGHLNTIGVEPPRSRAVGGIVEDPAFADLRNNLAIGDEILAVNGVAVPENQGQDLARLVEFKPGQKVELTVKRKADGSIAEIQAPLETYGEWDMGLRIGVGVAKVMPGGQAEKAGFKDGDLIVASQFATDASPKRFAKIKDLNDAVTAASLNIVAVGFSHEGQQNTASIRPAMAPPAENIDADADTLLGVVGVMDGEAGFKVASVLESSPLFGAVKPGDHINSIGGAPLERGKSLRESVETAASRALTLFVVRSDKGAPAAGVYAEVPEANLKLTLSPRIIPEYRRPMVGVELVAGPVVAVEPDSFADTSLGGKNVLEGARLAALQYSPDLSSTILRFVYPEGSPKGKDPVTMVAATPAAIRDNPLAAGLNSRLPVYLNTAEMVKPMPFVPALGAAGRKWVDLSLMVYRVIHKLIVRSLPLDAIGGPVQLFRIIKVADDRGFAYFLYVVALISINLGVCNLLPFPVLDGGHLLFLLIEWMMGRPPPPAVKETAQWIGLACLLTLMLTVTGYDLLHLFSGTG